MKNSEREAKRWIFQAEDDYRFVEWIMKEDEFYDKGCFICQQSAEKALKACLYASGQRHVFGHSLHELCQSIMKIDARFKSVAASCNRLDRFYIPTRYPNGLPGGVPFEVFSQSDLNEAATDSKQILDESRRFLSELGIV